MIGKITTAALLAASAFGLVGTPASADPPAPPPQPSPSADAPAKPLQSGDVNPLSTCNPAAPPDKDHSHAVSFKFDRIPIRSGAEQDCKVVDYSYRSQLADYYCSVRNREDNRYYTYLRNVNSGRKGWVWNGRLANGGSHVRC